MDRQEKKMVKLSYIKIYELKYDRHIFLHNILTVKMTWKEKARLIIELILKQRKGQAIKYWKERINAFIRV